MMAHHEREWKHFVVQRVGQQAAAALELQGFFRSRRTTKKSSRCGTPTKRRQPTARPLGELQLNMVSDDAN